MVSASVTSPTGEQICIHFRRQRRGLLPRGIKVVCVCVGGGLSDPSVSAILNSPPLRRDVTNTYNIPLLCSHSGRL